MKRIMLAAISLFTVAAALGQVANPNAVDVTALVRAMRADELILEVSKSALAQAKDEGHITATQYTCFQKLPASAFTADLGKFLLTQLTREEIVEALAFYQSPSGIKLVDFLIVSLAQDAGDSFAAKPSASEPRTVDDLKAIQTFSRTGAGQKLVENRLVMMSEESREISRKIIAKRLTACGAKVSS